MKVYVYQIIIVAKRIFLMKSIIIIIIIFKELNSKVIEKELTAINF